MTVPDHGGTPALASSELSIHAPSAQAAAAESAPSTPARLADRQPRWRSRTRTPTVLLLVAVVLLLCYVAVSGKIPINSDAAGASLQAWSMLHGNLLLHGWWVSDVSFYTTELPEYMLVEAVFGLHPYVIHIAEGLTYTLVVLGVAWLAAGQARGRAAIARMLLAGGIMLAPQVAGATVLIPSPSHFGSVVPVLAVLLLLDRAPRRWWVPALVGVVLSWGLVADKVLLVTAVLPLLAICGWRACYGLLRRQSLRTRSLELSLICSAVIAVGLSSGILALIASHGGFTVWPVRAKLVPWALVLAHLKVIPHGLALLFGASTHSHWAAIRGLALLHLAGFGLAIWGFCAALWRFPRLSLVDQVLVGAVLFNLLTYILLIPWTIPSSAREYAAVLPLSAVLAGRMAGKRLLSAKFAPVTVALLAGYVLSLATVISVPSSASVPHVTRATEPLGHWLMSHHLDYGLGGYSVGNTTTLDTGNRVHVLAVTFYRGRCYPLVWEARASDYNAQLHDATFMVQTPAIATILKVFGHPDNSYQVGAFRVLVWHKNLLSQLQPVPRPPLSDSPDITLRMAQSG